MSATARVYEAHREFLWGLCYRMTGNAADADDVVQETFVRALEKPPPRTDQPMRPWLVRVAMNLSRDLLRRRRRGYTGPWLPSPIPTAGDASPPSFEPRAQPGDSPMARYDLMESVSFAFLLAIEALTPAQRAVLLLRDVFDYSTEETAGALGMTESNVKVTLHRARGTMRNYDRQRRSLTSERAELTRHALEEFMLLLEARDIAGLERLLAEDVIEMSDGGGEVFAALAPIKGRAKVIRLLLGLSEKLKARPAARFRMLNGLPAVLLEIPALGPGYASRFTLHCQLDESGRINGLQYVLAPRKLTAV
jgi:RNA polymerase sigma-70 factor (ECF subfamily)